MCSLGINLLIFSLYLSILFCLFDYFFLFHFSSFSSLSCFLFYSVGQLFLIRSLLDLSEFFSQRIHFSHILFTLLIQFSFLASFILHFLSYHRHSPSSLRREGAHLFSLTVGTALKRTQLEQRHMTGPYSHNVCKENTIFFFRPTNSRFNPPQEVAGTLVKRVGNEKGLIPMSRVG